MDLSTTYMGLSLEHPVVPSASPLSDSIDNIRLLEDAGASAIVLPSLFEEQLEGESHLLNHYLSIGAADFVEALNYFPEMDKFGTGPQQYLELIRQAKEATDIPIIGSLNGMSPGGWSQFASKIEEAGADALELNIYDIVTNAGITSYEIEQTYFEIVKQVTKQVQIPVAVKVGPYFSAFANVAQGMAESGAKALVLFNRFYQPEIDPDAFEIVPNLTLSEPYELRLPLRWTAILYGRVPVDLAITSGIQNHDDVLRAILAGANITMMASELLRNGIQRIGQIRNSLERWIEENEFDSLAQIRGRLSQSKVTEPTAFERANYMKILDSW